jgi:hypothetical protein
MITLILEGFWCSSSGLGLGIPALTWVGVPIQPNFNVPASKTFKGEKNYSPLLFQTLSSVANQGLPLNTGIKVEQTVPTLFIYATAQ